MATGRRFEARALKGAIVRADVETTSEERALLPFGARVRCVATATSSLGVARALVAPDDGADDASGGSDERAGDGDAADDAPDDAALGWVSLKCLREAPRRTPFVTPAAALARAGDEKCGYDRAAARVPPAAAAVLEARNLGWLGPLLDAAGPQYVVVDGWRGRAAALRSAAAAALVAGGGASASARPLQPRVRGDAVVYLRALECGGLGLIEASEDGGQAGEPKRIGEAYAAAAADPLLDVLAGFDAVRDALIAAIAAAGGQGWAPKLIDGVSGLGKHEDFDLENPDDVQLACYSPSTLGYRLHRDTMDEHTPFPARLLTCIAYLNEGWDERADGGRLRLYLGRESTDLRGPRRVFAPGGDCPYVDIAPALDRLVVFRSSSFHEVYPTNRRRVAVTQWLAGRP